MIKISKKAAFIIMIIMCIIFVISLTEINWELIKEGENVFKEINPSITYLVLTILYFMFYMKRVKEEKEEVK